MGFFDDIGKKITQTGQSAAGKAKDMTEIASLSSKIIKLNSSLNEKYSILGKEYYNSHKDSKDNEFDDILGEIAELTAQLKQCVESRAQLKGNVICPKCAAECDGLLKFCVNCGTELPKNNTEAKVSEATEVPVQAADGSKPAHNEVKPESVNAEAQVKYCPKCGSPVSADAKFCIGCGNQLQ